MGCTNYTTLCGSTERAGDLAGTRVKGWYVSTPCVPSYSAHIDLCSNHHLRLCHLAHDV